MQHIVLLVRLLKWKQTQLWVYAWFELFKFCSLSRMFLQSIVEIQEINVCCFKGFGRVWAEMSHVYLVHRGMQSLDQKKEGVWLQLTLFYGLWQNYSVLITFSSFKELIFKFHFHSFSTYLGKCLPPACWCHCKEGNLKSLLMNRAFLNPDFQCLQIMSHILFALLQCRLLPWGIERVASPFPGVFSYCFTAWTS